MSPSSKPDYAGAFDRLNTPAYARRYAWIWVVLNLARAIAVGGICASMARSECATQVWVRLVVLIAIVAGFAQADYVVRYHEIRREMKQIDEVYRLRRRLHEN